MCGGYGYMNLVGFGIILVIYVFNVMYEGDNNVFCL